MHPKRISKWVVKPFVYFMGSNNIQRAWLFEPNSITERNSVKHEQLQLCARQAWPQGGVGGAQSPVLGDEDSSFGRSASAHT